MNEDTLKILNLGKKITSIALLIFFAIPVFGIKISASFLGSLNLGSASAIDFAVGLHSSYGTALTSPVPALWLLALFPIVLIVFAFADKKIPLERKIKDIIVAVCAVLELIALIVAAVMFTSAKSGAVSLDFTFYLYALLAIAAVICFAADLYFEIKTKGTIGVPGVGSSMPGSMPGAGVNPGAGQVPTQPVRKAFCPQCGSATTPSAKFCPKCGRPLN